MASVRDPKTDEIVDIEDDIDLKTGENNAVKRAIDKGYSQVYDVVDPKTKKVLTVDDVKAAQAKGYIEKGEWDGRQDAVDRSNSSASGLESATRASIQGLSSGFSDEAVGAGSALINKARTLGTSDFGKDYEKARDKEREANSQAKAANPDTYAAGEFAGAVGGAFIPGVGAVGAVGKGATLGAKVLGGMRAGAFGGALAGFGNSEGSAEHQLKDTIEGAGTGLAIGGAMPVALEAGKQVLKVPGKALDWYKGSLVNHDPSVSEFLGKAENIEAVRKYPVDANVMERSVKTLKDEYPVIYSDIAKELRGVSGEAKKVLNKAYGDVTTIADSANKPVSMDAPNSTDDLLHLIDDALNNPTNDKYGLQIEAQNALQQVRDDIHKSANFATKSQEVVDPVSKEVRDVAVPFTEGEMFKKGWDAVKRVKKRAFAEDSFGNTDPKLKEMRDFVNTLTETLYANSKGTYPQEALDALKKANTLYRENAVAKGGFKSLTRNVDGSKGAVDADKIKNALHRIEGEDGLEAAINRQRAVAGQEGKVNFEPVTQQKNAIREIEAERANRESQKIRFDNLNDHGDFGKLVSKLPIIGPYVPTSTQNKVRLLNKIDEGVVKGRKAIDVFTQKERLQQLAEQNPIKASWLKQLVTDPKPVTRAVIQSMARHSKVSEDEIEQDLKELGLSIKP